MSNETTILAALNAIEAAIRNCCGGGNALDDAASTNTPEAVYKCKAAHAIFAEIAEFFQYVQDVPVKFNLFDWLANYQRTYWKNALDLYFKFSGLWVYQPSLFIPSVEIVTWLELTNEPDDLGTIDTFRLAWLANTDTICELYNAATVIEAKAIVEQNAAVILAGLSIETSVKNLILDLITGLLTNSFVNRLFDVDSVINNGATQDCGGCGGGVTLLPQTMCGIPAGTVTNQSGNLYTVQSAQVQWGCNPASPMQSIVLMFDVACNVKIHSGDRVWYNIGTYYGGANNQSFDTYFGAIAAIATNDGIGLHVAGTSPYTVVFEIEAVVV